MNLLPTDPKQFLKRGIQVVLTPRVVGRPAVRDLFFLVAREFTPSVVSNVGDIQYHVSTADRTVGREVFLTGGYDAPGTARTFRVLHVLGHRDFTGKTFVDVGANIGTGTLPAVVRHGFARAVAIEPDETNYGLLVQSIVANELEQRVKPIQAALSDEEKEVLLELSPVNHGDHRVRRPAADATAATAATADDPKPGGDRRVVPVPATTFDALVRQGLIPLDELGLVWMDAEGHEGHVFQGARTLLASEVPVVVAFRPDALGWAGGLERYESLVQAHYPWMVDVRATVDPDRPELLPTSRLPALRDAYPGRARTDLLLLKRRP